MKLTTLATVASLAVLVAIIAVPAGAASSDCDVKNPPPIVNDKPQDTDGDCLYEDVDGDGQVTILDTQALFEKMQTNKAQNHPQAYDFSAVSPSAKVTIFDVAAHWLNHVR